MRINVVLNSINKEKNGSLQLVAYDKEEIGILEIITHGLDYFKIDKFKVQEKHRKQGVGKKLIESAVEIIKESGGKEIIVFPNSEPYSGESPIDNQQLCEIYEKLGFELIDKPLDIKKEYIRKI